MLLSGRGFKEYDKQWKLQNSSSYSKSLLLMLFLLKSESERERLQKLEPMNSNLCWSADSLSCRDVLGDPSGRCSLQWAQPPKNVLVVKKLRDKSVSQCFMKLVTYLVEEVSPGNGFARMHVYVRTVVVWNLIKDAVKLPCSIIG